MSEAWQSRIPVYADGTPVAAGDKIRYRQAPGGLLARSEAWKYGTAVPHPSDGEMVLEADGRHYGLFSHEIEKAHTVTVTFARKRYRLEFSELPGRSFGPYDFAEAIGQLHVAALLSRLEARDLVMDAATSADHTATAPAG